MNQTIADIHKPASRAHEESERNSKMELIAAILKRRQEAGERVKGSDFDELLDMETGDLYGLDVKEIDRIYYAKNGIVDKSEK
jgi:hypothetical protein